MRQRRFAAVFGVCAGLVAGCGSDPAKNVGTNGSGGSSSAGTDNADENRAGEGPGRAGAPNSGAGNVGGGLPGTTSAGKGKVKLTLKATRGAP